MSPDNNDIYSRSDRRVNHTSFNSHTPQNNNQKKRRKQKKKMLIKKASAVACILAMLVGTVAVLSCFGVFSGKNDSIVNAENSNTSSNSKSVAETVVSDVSSEPPKPQKPVYLTDASFNTNLKKISSEEIKKLDEKITSEFVVLYDASTDEILYQKNGSKKCYPASTTKLLTAIVSSAIIKPETKITVGKEIELIGEDSSTAGLQVGDKLTFEALIDALLLPSGNDAAYTIAVNTARIYKNDDKLSDKEAVSVFMELVNDAAKQLNATGTHFVTPDGWHDDNHYTNAQDLAKIAAYARTVPLIKKSVSKPYAKWKLLNGGNVEWYNSNQLLLSSSGLYSKYVDGMKTGFTDEAGSSVVASATMNNHTLIAVVMNGQTLYTKYDDANTLFKTGFKFYGFDYTYGD